jgi:hypothetical protein
MSKFVESLKIDENVFELTKDAEIGYLEHFCAPFTGGDCCVVPDGTAFAPHGPMRADALYMHLVEPNESLLDTMRNKVKTKYDEHLQMYERLQGFSFYITEEQLRTFPLKFRSGSLERLITIMELLRDPKNYY